MIIRGSTLEWVNSSELARLGVVASTAVLFGCGILLYPMGARVLAFGGVCLSSLYLLSRVKSVDPFSPAAFLGIVVSYYVLGISNPLDLDIHGVNLASSISITLAGIVACGVMSFLCGMAAARRLGRNVYDGGAALPASSLHFALWTSFLIGAIFSLPRYVVAGIPVLSVNPSQARAEFLLALSPYAFAQWTFLEVAAFLGALLLCSERFKQKWALVPTTGAIVLLAGLSSRVLLGTAIVIAGVAYHYLVRPLKGVKLALLVGVSLLVISGLWLWRKREYLFSTEAPLPFIPDPGAPAFTIAALLSLAGLAIFTRTSVEAFGYLLRLGGGAFHGEISMMSFYALAPGVQDNLGLYRVTSLLGGDPTRSGGSTVSLVGGLYLDFGMLGVIIGMFSLGLILTLLHRRAVRGQSIESVFIYAVSFSYYLNMIYGGQFVDVSLFWRIIVVEAVIAVAYLAAGRRLPVRLGLVCTIMPPILGYGLYRLLIAGR